MISTQLVGSAAHAVDVVADVRMRVEDLGARRQVGTELLVPHLRQLVRPLYRSPHES